jgi:hypothetical protein
MTWPTSNPVARELDDFWKETQSLFQQWWFEADLDTKMVTNQQDYWASFYTVNYRNQKMLQFNKMLRLHNMIEGYQRDNRLMTVLQASDNDPDMGETAKQRTTVLNWVHKQDSTYEKISDTFAGSNIQGLNLMEFWMDFREDPENGEIRSTRLPFNSFIMSPFWEKQDLSDCDRIWTRKYLTGKQIKSLFPDIQKELPSLGKGYSSRDGKFQFLAQNWYQSQQDIYAYDQYWVKDYRAKRKVLDKATGEVVDWNGTKDQFKLLKQFNPNIELITTQSPTIKLYILINNNLVYEEKRPFGLDRLPFACSLCYFYPEVQNYAYRFQGIPRAIRDSQIETNKRRNRLLDVLDAQVQSGLMVKEDALVNPEDAFFQGPGKVLYFKNTANLATDVVPIPSPPVAPGWLELIQSVEKEITDIVGPEELFGQNLGAKEMTGVLMKLKQGAGLVGLRNIFDRLNLFQTYAGEIVDQLIVGNFSEGKVSRILGEKPSQNFFDETFTKYHCTVEEAELTASQRQLQFMQAMQMKQMGIPISNKYIIEKSSLQDKKGIIEEMQQAEQQQAELAHMQTLQQMQQQDQLARSLEAKAQSDFASAEEKKARAVSDISLAKKNQSLAAYDTAKAALENAKAMAELDQVPENRVIKLADMLLKMQSQQASLERSEEMKSQVEAQIVGAKPSQAEQESKVKKAQ